jgi:uncharacterized delta-60 repeat protein
MSGTKRGGMRMERLEPRTHLSAGLLAAGDLDPSFGTSGRAVVDVGSMNDAALDMLALPGGKTLILGRHFPDASSGTFDTLIRLNSDGARDASFGQGGMVTLGNPYGASVLATDQHILVAGSTAGLGTPSPNGVNDLQLSRFNLDGSVDTTFGAGGRVTTDTAVRQDVAVKVLRQDDGRIVVVGYEQKAFLSRVLQNPHVILVRYEPDGRLDTTFGNGGIVLSDVPQFGAERAASAALQADGKIVVVGSVMRTEGDGFLVSGTEPRLLVTRYDPDGSVDRSFGRRGVLVSRKAQTASDVRVLTAGRILVTGTRTRAPNSRFAVMRLNRGGSFDGSFGTDGVATVGFRRLSGDPQDSAVATRLAGQADGKLVVAGSAGGRIALARFTPRGRLDHRFGSGGRVLTDTGLDGGAGRVGMTLQDNGRITASADGSDLVLARYLPDPPPATG